MSPMAPILLHQGPGTQLPPDAKTVKSARDFEAMAIGQLLQPMFETVDSAHSLFGGGAAEETWKPMMVTEIAKKIAANGGLGLARPVLAEMLRMQEAHAMNPVQRKPKQ